MYLTSLNVKQVGEASGIVCSALVEWSYGNRLPSVVEIYADDTRIEQLTVRNSTDPISTTVSLRAGSSVRVSVCPRFVENNTLQDQMPNAQENNQYWESFCLIQSITTRGKPGTGEVTPKPPPPAAPTITSAEAVPASVMLLNIPFPTILKQEGGIRVSWISLHDFSSFRVLFSRSEIASHEIDIEEGGKSGSFYRSEGVIPGLKYEFIVRGRDSGFLGFFPTYSNWSSLVTIVAKENLTSLRQYLRTSDLDGTNGIRQYLFADAGSLRSFMQLQ